MIAYADNVTLADVRAGVIASGVIPDTYLIEPTGTYWNANDGILIKNDFQQWIDGNNNTLASARFQNSINRALYNVDILLEGRANINEVTAMLVAKERLQGTYSETGYLKKYHDYVIGEYSQPSNTTAIETKLNSVLGNMASLAGAIKTVTDKAASIAAVPDDLWTSDPEYWLSTAMDTYCKLNHGPTCTPSVTGAQPTVYTSIAYNWSIRNCLLGNAICGGDNNGFQPISPNGVETIDFSRRNISGTAVYAIFAVQSAPVGTDISLKVDMGNYGRMIDIDESDTRTGSRGTVAVHGWGYGYTEHTLEDRHPCTTDSRVLDNTLRYTQCLLNDRWSFSGKAKVEFPGTGIIRTIPRDTTPTIIQHNPDITTTDPPKFGYIGHTYHYDVDATDANTGDTLTYSASIVGKGDTVGIRLTDIIDSGDGNLTWAIPYESKYIGKYDVTVKVEDGTKENNILRSDTLEFTLTVMNNSIPVLGVTGAGGSLVNEFIKIERHSGTLFGEISYNFTGTDDDTDDDLTLLVTRPPSATAAALTDCKTDDSKKIYDEDNPVVVDKKESPINAITCIVALNSIKSDYFTLQLTDGVDAVVRTIKYQIQDNIQTYIGVAALVGSQLSPLAGPLAPVVALSVNVGALVTTQLLEWNTIAWRCEHDVWPEGHEPNPLCITPRDISLPCKGGVSCGASGMEQQWTVIANITNTVNMTIYDTDLEPNKVYTYVARVFAGDKASDYIPLGNVTTPPDGPPVITLKGGATMNTALGSPFVDPGYVAIDDYDGNVTDRVTTHGTVNTDRVGKYRIFYFASDTAGNLAESKTRTVRVVNDNIPPVLILKGLDTISIHAGTTYTDPGYVARDNRDGNITDRVVITGTINTRAPGTYTLQYDVSDSVGNKAPTQTRTVIVIGDDTPPTITLKGDKTITIEAGLTYVDPGYTATDNRDGNITDMVTVTGTVDTNIPGTYTIQYDVIDSSSNAAIQQIRTVTVVDTIPPTLTLKGGSSITIPASAPYVEPGYIATDNIDGNVRVEIVGWVNTNRPGSYSIQYTAYDSSGNNAPPQIRMIIVEDVTPPVITLKGNSSIIVPASMPYVDPGYTAIDNIDGDITGRVVISGMVDTDTLGDYTIYYDVSDWARNAAIQQNRTVTVIDLTPPILTLKGGSSITVPASVPYVDPGYTAIDNIDGNLTENVVITGHIDTDVPGTYTLHYDVWDAEFNIPPTQNRTVIVADMTPPTITLKGNATITIPMGPTYTDPGYTATDNIDGDITSMVTVTGMVNPLIPGTYTIQYMVTDAADNTKQQDRVVTVSPPTDTTQYCNSMTLAQLMASGKYNIINKMFSSDSNIKGTNNADLIIVGNNGPTIDGKAGDDCIIGGTGNDIILGQAGNDIMYGNGGNDEIRGGENKDLIHGGPGNDELHGGSGHDTIHGESGADEIHGGPGNDTIYGGSEGDTIWGLGGNDTIYGEGGNDTIYAGPGIDTIHGGPGTDTIDAGETDTVHNDDDSSGE